MSRRTAARHFATLYESGDLIRVGRTYRLSDAWRVHDEQIEWCEHAHCQAEVATTARRPRRLRVVPPPPAGPVDAGTPGLGGALVDALDAPDTPVTRARRAHLRAVG